MIHTNLNPGKDTREQATKRTRERRHEGTHEGTPARTTNQPTLNTCTNRHGRCMTGRNPTDVLCMIYSTTRLGLLTRPHPG